MLEDIVRTGLTEMNIAVDNAAIERLRRYFEMLEETNKVMNLTAISGEEAVATLHFLDCAAILKETDISGKTLIDIGTGAGFPGMVLKILRPDTKAVLIDSLDKRIGFLNRVKEELQLKEIECIHARAEEAAKEYRGKGDIVTSRAVDKLNVLAELSLPFLKKDGLFIAMKGPEYDEELETAKPAIKILGGKTETCAQYKIPGTDVVHSLIIVRKQKETSDKYPRRWSQIKKIPL